MINTVVTIVKEGHNGEDILCEWLCIYLPHGNSHYHVKLTIFLLELALYKSVLQVSNVPIYLIYLMVRWWGQCLAHFQICFPETIFYIKIKICLQRISAPPSRHVLFSYMNFPSFQYSSILTFWLFIFFSTVSGLIYFSSSSSINQGDLNFLKPSQKKQFCLFIFNDILSHSALFKNCHILTPLLKSSHIPLTDHSIQFSTCKIIETH